ncbi:MAG: hypothetical protein U0Q22_04655 [Acidimicrobiales bacterium]
MTISSTNRATADVDAARALHPASSSRIDRPLSGEALEYIALGLAQVVGAADGTLRRGEVRRTKVLATAVYDAWVVELGPQTAIEPHDHEGSIGVVAVTYGRLVEFAVDDVGERRSRLRQLVVGDHTTFGATHRHSLVNPELRATTTVQVFSPPLGDEVTGRAGTPGS